MIVVEMFSRAHYTAEPKENYTVDISMGDRPYGRPSLWETTLMGDHPYGRPLLWETTLMGDHPYGRPSLW